MRENYHLNKITACVKKKTNVVVFFKQKFISCALSFKEFQKTSKFKFKAEICFYYTTKG